MTWVWPDGTTTQPHVSSPFGPRKSPGAGASTNHMGADFTRFRTVCAIGAGRVLAVGVLAGWAGGGNQVYLDHGAGIRSRSLHLASIHVANGDYLGPAAALGPMGKTGTAFGIHLHLEVAVNGVRVDPVAFLAARVLTGTAAGDGSSDLTPTPLLEADMRVIKIIDGGGFRYAITNGYEFQQGELNDAGGLGAMWEAIYGPARLVNGKQWAEAQRVAALFSSVRAKSIRT